MSEKIRDLILVHPNRIMPQKMREKLWAQMYDLNLSEVYKIRDDIMSDLEEKIWSSRLS